MSDETNTARATGGDEADDSAEDDALLAELRGMTNMIDPIPPAAIVAARSAIAWRTMDVELAELTADTSVEPARAGVRGVEAPVLLTFEAPGLTIEVEVVVDSRGARALQGQLVPPGPGSIEVRHAGGRSRVSADEVGRFRSEGVAPGPVSLHCQTGTGAVETDWFLA